MAELSSFKGSKCNLSVGSLGADDGASWDDATQSESCLLPLELPV